MVQIVVRHIGVSEAVYRDRMGKTDDLTCFFVRLQSAGMTAAAVCKSFWMISDGSHISPE